MSKKEGVGIMKEITLDNFDVEYVDTIEQREIDKFVCDEMRRQIHRYIKGMSGRKQIMEKFEEKLSTLSLTEKEEAVARYIDLNRKVLSGLDFMMVLSRAIANYCDTFGYFKKFITNNAKMAFYLKRIRDKYLQFHEVFEENGKFGLKNHRGEVLVSPSYDFLRTCYTYVDDLCTMPVIAEKNGKLGLILPDKKDTVIADFCYDDISLRDEYPYFEVARGAEHGFLDPTGQFVAG